jgi:undecaprenyl diphosphate synthase
LAVDYSSRWAIAAGALLPDVDLLIRTGGEQRLSDFLLWECAYAELHFTATMWPAFGAAELAAAVAEFRTRERRFGGLPQTQRTGAIA